MNAAVQIAAVDHWSEAAQLAVEGYPIFPCHTETKQPLTRHGFKDATTDLDKIDQWCDEFPSALIAVPTGATSGLFVVDIDPSGAQWYADHLADLACGRVHRTRRGHHLLYRMPEKDLRNSASKIAAGVDIRANGGYIIFWPAHGFDAVGDLSDLTAPPSWLIDRLAAPPATESKSSDPLTIVAGGRNQALTSLAGKMRKAGASQDELATALAALNGRCNPPLSEREVQAIAQSVARYAPSNAEAKPLRGEDFADMKPTLNVRATIKNVLAPNSLAALIGPSNIGKSFFVTDIGCHVAAKRPWRGLQVNGGLVICCALEGAASARNRNSAWRTRNLKDGESIPLRTMIDGVNLRDPIDQGRLIDFIRAAELDHGEKAVLVIVDTLSRAMDGGNENSSEDMGAMVRGGDRIREETGATVLFVHHLGKDETKGARGHSLLRAALDTEIELSIVGEQRIATITKQRDWPTGGKFAFVLDVVELGTDLDGDVVTSCVATPCDATPEPRPEMKGKAQRQLLNALRGRNTPGMIFSLQTMREVGREVGQTKGTARSAVDALSMSPHMVPTIGGYRLAD